MERRHTRRLAALTGLGGATVTEKAGIQRRVSSRARRAITPRPAKMRAGSETARSNPRNTAAEATPETTMAASMAATTMNSRVLPVLRAAIPMMSSITK